jgi:carbamoyltransferase
MRILGISAFYHDSAAALVEDGYIIAAAQEERFTRKKQDARYPENAIRYCLDEGGLTLKRVVLSWLPGGQIKTSAPAGQR